MAVRGAGRASAAPAAGVQSLLLAFAAPASHGARARVVRSLLCGHSCAAHRLVLRPVQRPVLLGAVLHGATRGTECELPHGRLPLVARRQGAALQAVLRDVGTPPCVVSFNVSFELL